MIMTFDRKGYGRIYTDKEENIQPIKDIIKEMDEFEFGYLPKDLIAVYQGEIRHVYIGKFDELDLNDLMKRCWNKGIHVFCTFGHEPY